jgi:hypothetical protein
VLGPIENVCCRLLLCVWLFGGGPVTKVLEHVPGTAVGIGLGLIWGGSSAKLVFCACLLVSGGLGVVACFWPA